MEVRIIDVESITKNEHNELIQTLKNLIEVIEDMLKIDSMYILKQNYDEAKDWLAFLEKHIDKKELKSLEREIAERFVYKFDVEINDTELDTMRTNMIKTLLMKFNKFLQ